MKILVVSALPPPIGGVTVHTDRLVRTLIEAGHSVEVLDYQKKTRLLTLVKMAGSIITNEYDIIHIHASAWKKFKFILPLLFLISMRSAVIITIHSGSFRLNPKMFLYYRFVFWNIRAIIAVNDKISRQMAALKIKKMHIAIIPAFLPLNEVGVLTGIQDGSDPRLIVVTSGYFTPLYNYEIILNAIETAERKDIECHIATYNTVDEPYKQKIEERLKGKDNIHLHYNLSQNEFCALLKTAHVYVRATITDGDSIALREALQYNLVTFATDVVTRPEGCYLFELNDYRKLASYFDQAGSLITTLDNSMDNFSKIIEVYKTSIGK